MTEISLCSVDVIPARCGVQAEIADGHVRFRANRIRVGRITLRVKIIQVSEWSGWFPLDDAPIVLEWKAFEWPD